MWSENVRAPDAADVRRKLRTGKLLILGLIENVTIPAVAEGDKYRARLTEVGNDR